MASHPLRLTKSEWRQVSRIAAGISWRRRSASKPDESARMAAITASLNDRSADALQQLLRAIAI